MNWDSIPKNMWKEAKPVKKGHNGNTEIIRKEKRPDTELNKNLTMKKK